MTLSNREKAIALVLYRALLFDDKEREYFKKNIEPFISINLTDEQHDDISDEVKDFLNELNEINKNKIESEKKKPPFPLA